MEKEILKKIISGVYGLDIKQMGADEFLDGLAEQADLIDD